ncbi:MAG TPA: mechanosensitive ion channel [Anaerolineales bacterium]|jgi:small-conductance mechanosensitive channel|nr:mechanosensitive ion channel [Anaerolineales bacterium]
MQPFLDQMIAGFLAGIPKLITALVIFILSLYFARVISNFLQRVLQRRRAPAGVVQLLGQLALWSVIVAGAITALQQFFQVTAFLAGLGILGFTVGFALQDIMKNFASGVILLLQQPFHVGETIGVKGFDGTVMAIDLRATEMRAADGRVVILPNAEVLANPIINYSRANHRRVDLSLNLSHTTEPGTVRQILLDAIQDVPGFVNEPEPVIVFNSLTDHALELNSNFWIDVTKNDPLHAKDMALLNVKSAFHKQGIEIPHPIQSVFSKQVDR